MLVVWVVLVVLVVWVVLLFWGLGEEGTEGVVGVVECRVGGEVDWVGGEGVVGVEDRGGFGVGLGVDAEDGRVEGWFCWACW